MSKSGREVILGKRFVDSSGDADLAFFAGCECLEGRLEDGKYPACSLEFRLGGVNWDTYLNSDLKRDDSQWVKRIAASVESGELPYMIDNHLNWITHVPGRPQQCSQDEVSICVALSRNCDPLSVRDLTRMYLEGREQADILSAFIKRHIPGFEQSYLIDTAPLLGVRESRRVVGEYVMKTLDFARTTTFDDAIATALPGLKVKSGQRSDPPPENSG